MGVENLFAAKVFASLLPWLDQDRDYAFMKDEGGQNLHATPDLCFHFKDSINGPIRIEFKVVNNSRKQGHTVRLTCKQVNSWAEPAFPDIPHCWVGISKRSNRFFFWHHANGMLQNIQAVTRPATGYCTVPIPQTVVVSGHFLTVYRELLVFAANAGLCP